jgi:hypothetical protein
LKWTVTWSILASLEAHMQVSVTDAKAPLLDLVRRAGEG